MRGAFGHHSQVYSRKLSDEQLQRWILAGAQVMSDPRLGQNGPLSGQQLYTSINSVRSRVNLPETLEPPARVAFGLSAVGALVAENTEAGASLRLRITGELNEDVMVFGQEPCSAGRSKRRNVAYLGLLPPPVNGWSDIIHLYRARYGEPRPGTRIFIVTCQTKDGWKGMDRETSALVPDRPKGEQELQELNGLPGLHGVNVSPSGVPETSEPANSQNPYMYKGSTRDAEGSGSQAAPGSQGSAEPGVPSGQAGAAEVAGGERDSQWPMADGQLGRKAGLGGGEGDGHSPMADS
jgi:hypothetical protein